ncbi:E3 ubiquitin-protein ligase SIAH1B-like [Bacillus rossius redtenbacheri]|uniref:E3 ubiquitin-protein ligase SIAH1B-like n=1 Tax=Bacillus rossius redtenbacheri TaxID=93214 RepID=UPI002FDEB3AF
MDYSTSTGVGHKYICPVFPTHQVCCFGGSSPRKGRRLGPRPLKKAPAAMTSLVLKRSREDVMQLLECPVCLTVMTPPIHMCANGHDVCHKCWQQLTKCPLCKARLLSARNIVLEQLLDGAELQDAPGPLAWDDSVAPFRADSFRCLAGEGAACRFSFSGNRQDILSHVRAQHKDLFVHMGPDSKTFVWRESSTPPYQCRLVFCQGQIFWFHKRFDRPGGRVCAALRYVGGGERARGYQYKYTFSLPPDSTAVTRLAQSCSEDSSAIFARGDCVLLDYASLQKYVRDGTLTTTLKIKKLKQ